MNDGEIINEILKSAPAMRTRIVAILNAPMAITARVDALLNGTTYVADPEPTRGLWTISNTARKLGVGRNTVRKLIACNELDVVDVPFGHPTNRSRITAQSVDAYIDRMKHTATGKAANND